MTSLGVVARHPARVVVRPLVVYPVAKLTAVTVTGRRSGSRCQHDVAGAARVQDVAGCRDATAGMVRLDTVADLASPRELSARPTVQFVAA